MGDPLGLTGGGVRVVDLSVAVLIRIREGAVAIVISHNDDLRDQRLGRAILVGDRDRDVNLVTGLRIRGHGDDQRTVLVHGDAVRSVSSLGERGSRRSVDLVPGLISEGRRCDLRIGARKRLGGLVGTDGRDLDDHRVGGRDVAAGDELNGQDVTVFDEALIEERLDVKRLHVLERGDLVGYRVAVRIIERLAVHEPGDLVVERRQVRAGQRDLSGRLRRLPRRFEDVVVRDVDSNVRTGHDGEVDVVPHGASNEVLGRRRLRSQGHPVVRALEELRGIPGVGALDLTVRIHDEAVEVVVVRDGAVGEAEGVFAILVRTADHGGGDVLRMLLEEVARGSSLLILRQIAHLLVHSLHTLGRERGEDDLVVNRLRIVGVVVRAGGAVCAVTGSCLQPDLATDRVRGFEVDSGGLQRPLLIDNPLRLRTGHVVLGM